LPPGRIDGVSLPDKDAPQMIHIKLTSVMVDNQARARRFYSDVLGFAIKHDIPIGAHHWLTVVAPSAPDAVELLLEPTAKDYSLTFQQALYADGIPQTAFNCDDVEREYHRLIALGVVFKTPPTKMGAVTIAVFDDTCGNYIQLLQV
jgi:predicted enzyme related to lactoylglutathione lyase